MERTGYGIDWENAEKLEVEKNDEGTINIGGLFYKNRKENCMNFLDASM